MAENTKQEFIRNNNNENPKTIKQPFVEEFYKFLSSNNNAREFSSSQKTQSSTTFDNQSILKFFRNIQFLKVASIEDILHLIYGTSVIELDKQVYINYGVQTAFNKHASLLAAQVPTSLFQPLDLNNSMSNLEDMKSHDLENFHSLKSIANLMNESTQFVIKLAEYHVGLNYILKSLEPCLSENTIKTLANELDNIPKSTTNNFERLIKLFDFTEKLNTLLVNEQKISSNNHKQNRHLLKGAQQSLARQQQELVNFYTDNAKQTFSLLIATDHAIKFSKNLLAIYEKDIRNNKTQDLIEGITKTIELFEQDPSSFDGVLETLLSKLDELSKTIHKDNESRWMFSKNSNITQFCTKVNRLIDQHQPLLSESTDAAFIRTQYFKSNKLFY